jgi:crossover junction endodeoxyribonuclease RuvC
MLIIGLDPGLGCTGWGIVAKSGSRLTHIANGQVKTDAGAALAERLVTLDRELTDVILHYRPDQGAVEEVFVNANPQSTLKLGQNMPRVSSRRRWSAPARPKRRKCRPCSKCCCRA